jgi:hypothetical protein
VTYDFELKEATQCPDCGHPRWNNNSSKPYKEFHVIDFKNKLTNWMKHKVIAKAVTYPSERHKIDFSDDPDVLLDVQDGKLWKETIQEELEVKNNEGDHLFAFMQNNDGHSTTKHGRYSVIPIQWTLLNLPPWVRTKTGLIWTVAVISGPKCKNFTTYYKSLLRRASDFFSQGVRIFDAWQDKLVDIFFRMVMTVSDTRAKPHANKMVYERLSLHALHHALSSPLL